MKIKITKDGPYLIEGSIPLERETSVADVHGCPEKWEKGKSIQVPKDKCLCRCGNSKNKPFCDGHHSEVSFDGTETAEKFKYEDRAKIYDGPELTLKDVESYCSSACFCEAGDGTWTHAEESGNREMKKSCIQEACNCPSGRLVVCDKKTGKNIEPDFEPSISVLEDPSANVSGPLWFKGGIPIEGADGELYEKRNRVTLCRCGQSRNKPFCDSTHIQIMFKDENSKK